MDRKEASDKVLEHSEELGRWAPLVASRMRRLRKLKERKAPRYIIVNEEELATRAIVKTTEHYEELMEAIRVLANT